ncbi:MAG TPA: type II 3-dehydroquinate dehydratase, partial [Thermoleophilia bacterium]|nr:type II 3-dehydroquinate dehydratase [Thermoleophilia bacterium]
MADDAVKVLWLLHGVNLDLLGLRAAEHYGTLTLAELCDRTAAYAGGRGLTVRSFQTNHEGELVELLHGLARGDEPVAAVIINPGAWTHYSWALHDALEVLSCPIAEVHLSAVDQREEWRRVSVLADLAAVRVSGQGAAGYLRAVD